MTNKLTEFQHEVLTAVCEFLEDRLVSYEITCDGEAVKLGHLVTVRRETQRCHLLTFDTTSEKGEIKWRAGNALADYPPGLVDFLIKLTLAPHRKEGS
jgi:hypothetical protein